MLMNFNLKRVGEMIKKKRTMAVGLLNTLEKHAETALTDRQKITIAKKKYLMANKGEILQAVAEGYGFAIIAAAATEELLTTGIPTTFSITTKEGIEEEREPKFAPGEIKKLCEVIEP